MADRTKDAQQLAAEAIDSKEQLEKLVEDLSVGTRRARQAASTVLALVAKSDPELLKPYIPTFVDALNRPEAQTRWECLDALTVLAELDSRQCEKAIDEAEGSLFDEESGPVRLAAMRFLCKIGATTANRSKRVWPMVDEAIQCYHGDYEFNDMLAALVDFSAGKLDDSVKQELGERMAFDAANSKGTLKKRAQQIVENVK